MNGYQLRIDYRLIILISGFLTHTVGKGTHSVKIKFIGSKHLILFMCNCQTP